MILLSLTGLALADCSERQTAQYISQQISIGEAAYQNMDAEAFQQTHEQILQQIPCLQTPLNAAQATTFWRMSALAAFLARDEEAGVVAFQALLRISPGYVLSESIAPDGHPLQGWFEQAMERTSSLEEVLAEPRSGQIYIDGSAGLAAPVGIPYLFQMMDETGQITVSQVVQAGQRPPGYAAVQRGRINVPLAVTAGVSGAVAGGTWLLSSARKDTFWDPATPISDLETLQRQSNTLGTVALSAGVVALGSGAAAVFVGAW